MVAEEENEDENEVILTEENKEEIASGLGYSMELVESMLAQAKEKGKKGVRIPLLKY